MRWEDQIQFGGLDRTFILLNMYCWIYYLIYGGKSHKESFHTSKLNYFLHLLGNFFSFDIMILFICLAIILVIWNISYTMVIIIWFEACIHLRFHGIWYFIIWSIKKLLIRQLYLIQKKLEKTFQYCFETDKYQLD